MYLNTSKDARPSSGTVRLSPIEMPKFHCFTDLGLGDKSPDPEEVLKLFDQKKREAERRTHKIKLEKMYKLAMANAASAQRILAKHAGETGLDIEGNDPSRIADMTWTLVPLKETNKEIEAKNDSAKPWERYLRHKAIVPIQEVSEDDMDEEENKEKWLALRPESHKSTKSSGKRKALPSIQPLSITQTLQREKTIIAKCKSTFWVNYM